MRDHTARVRTQAGELRGRNFIVRAAMVKKQASCWPEATEVLKSRGEFEPQNSWFVCDRFCSHSGKVPIFFRSAVEPWQITQDSAPVTPGSETSA